MGRFVCVDWEELRRYYRGLRAALPGGVTVRDGLFPEGWSLPDRGWPTGYSRPTDFWITVWRDGGQRGEHVTIRPAHDGWWVEYDPENSWTGGRLVGGKQPTLRDALGAASLAMRRISDGDEPNRISRDLREQTGATA